MFENLNKDIKFMWPSMALSRLNECQNIKIDLQNAKAIISTSNDYILKIRESLKS